MHAVAAALRRADTPPVAVDLGFGAAPTTTLELASRLARVRPDVQVLGIEVDTERVRLAASYATDDVRFVTGGFDVAAALAGGQRATVIRAFNVLRQYDVDDVAPAWRRMATALTPDGILIEGTCDEIGRRAVWIALGADGRPRSLTFAVRFGAIERPSDLAERLPKSLIHRNHGGEPVHVFLRGWDRAWDHASPAGTFGVRQRWVDAARRLREAGVPVLDGPSRWRLGELTVGWAAIGPR